MQEVDGTVICPFTRYKIVRCPWSILRFAENKNSPTLRRPSGAEKMIFYCFIFLNYFFRLVKKFCARDLLKNNWYDHDGLCFLGLYITAFIIDNTLV